MCFIRKRQPLGITALGSHLGLSADTIMALSHALLLLPLLVVTGLCVLVSADQYCPSCRRVCCRNGSNYYCCYNEKAENGGGLRVRVVSVMPAQASCSGSDCSSDGESSFPKGSCCSDGQSCCGEGFTCNNLVGVNLCLPKDIFKDPVLDYLSREQQDGCADNSECPDGSECQGASGDFKGQCVNSAALIPWLKKEAALSGPVGDNLVHCGGGQYCRRWQTCCRSRCGMWGCCNGRKATCCSDGIHCCPSMTRCLVPYRLCSRSSEALSGVAVLDYLSREQQDGCADNSECPDGSECQGASGDLKGQCVNSAALIPWLKKEAALSGPVGDNVVHCGGGQYCRRWQTCCRSRRGMWGCCNGRRATCCSDGIHCCPSMTRCLVPYRLCSRSSEALSGVAVLDYLSREQQDGCAENSECPDGSECQGASGDLKGQCVNSAALIPWLKKEAALSGPVGDNLVHCGGGQYCRRWQTCCRSRCGMWGCCNGRRATCCSDGIHCCPSMTRCLVPYRLCSRSSEALSGVAVLDYLSREQQDGCADNSECPDGSECQGASGDLKGQCVNSAALIPWLKKEAALSGPVGDNVVHCGGGQYCRRWQTCCRSRCGMWGCCNGRRATCCSDGIHCCPSMTRCLVPYRLCSRSSEALSGLQVL
ncbi:progranulin-like isoform X2 [Petromyzon marinus]|uniref:Progranulin-like isoform X2 n=1 Tax=Petromyzon marinus TaxID=7757 RepID=A0AAJ7WRT1_PETMA|nr:progranulin-like isoform X2 [Petromyzon marinus]